MKLALTALLGALLATLAACQSDMTGPLPASTPDATLAPSTDLAHPDVPVGDVYLEEMLGRY